MRRGIVRLALPLVVLAWPAAAHADDPPAPPPPANEPAGPAPAPAPEPAPAPAPEPEPAPEPAPTEPAPPPPPTAPDVQLTEPAPAERIAPSARPADHTVYPWILVGVGTTTIVAGLALHITAPGLPSRCNADTSTCVRRPSQSNEDFESERSQAGASKAQPVIGTLVIVAGALTVAGGIVWRFLEKPGPAAAAPATASGRPRFTPFTTPGGGGGLAAYGTF